MSRLILTLFLFILSATNAVAGFVLTGNVGKLDAMLKMESTDADEAILCFNRTGMCNKTLVNEVKMEWYRLDPYIVLEMLGGDYNEYTFQPDDVSYTRFKDLKSRGQ